jgi:hypothetical protein
MKAKILYTPEEFKERGFDGEIAKVMRENKNTAIVGNKLNVDRHVIEFESWADLRNYKNPYK